MAKSVEGLGFPFIPLQSHNTQQNKGNRLNYPLANKLSTEVECSENR